jgi:type IV pilus assembly protein PilZ
MTADRRRHRRYATRIEVDWTSEETFLFAYITDISALGIFVQTDRPAPRGARITLRFVAPEDAADRLGRSEPPFEIDGEVAWSTVDDEDMAANDPRHGMGVQLVDLDDERRARIMELVQAIAYMDDPRGD